MSPSDGDHVPRLEQMGPCVCGVIRCGFLNISVETYFLGCGCVVNLVRQHQEEDYNLFRTWHSMAQQLSQVATSEQGPRNSNTQQVPLHISITAK